MQTPASLTNPAGTAPTSSAKSQRGGFGLLGRLSDTFRRLQSGLWKWEVRLRGAEMRGPVLFLGRPIVTLAPGSSIVFAGDNEVFSSVRCNDLGNIQPCSLRTIAPKARLELGKGVGLSGVGICAASSITIGEGTLIGTGALIFDSDFHRPTGKLGFEDVTAEGARAISIGRGCFIGARAIIMKGVTIGDRAAVAAGAVVTSNVPSGTVAIGNPARMMPWFAAEAAAAENKSET